MLGIKIDFLSEKITMLKHLQLLSFLLLLLQLQANAQDRFERRLQKDIRRFKGNDSAWIAQSTFGQDRFYIGIKRVSVREFESTIKSYNAETEKLITNARNNYRKGLYAELAGAGLALAGFVILDNHNNYRNRNNNSNVLPIGLIATSIVADGFGIAFFLKARNNFIDAMGVFNNAARANKNSASLHLGFQQHGIGLRLRF